MNCLLLIGFQNEYFSEFGKLHELLENNSDIAELKKSTLNLIERLNDDFIVVSAPIGFDAQYSDMGEAPYGILKSIADHNAFVEGTDGFKMIEELDVVSKPVLQLKTRRTLNAFQRTDLEELLTKNKIKKVYLAGVFTSLCIDSTARTAYEKGYEVFIIKDLVAGQSQFEHSYYFENIFPMYSIVTSSEEIIEKSRT